MNLTKFTFFFLLSLFSVLARAQDEKDVIDYLNRYKELAIVEQLRAGVPAAITLAQGIHESSAGKSELAVKGSNHFGIKCKSNWIGETILHDDDLKKECFRKYPNSEQSYIDHSNFLRGSNRYHFLFDLEITDYQGWASGLKRAGYATNPLYVKRLTDLVEKYKLQQYTYEGISRSNTTRPAELVPDQDQVRNLTHVDDPSTYYKGLKGFWAAKGETLLPKALEKNIRYAKLLALNDLDDSPLPTDMFIFTEKKRKVGTEEFHKVKEGETMLLIAQKEAMLLSNLYDFNNMIAGQEPEPGEKLALQYRSYETPKIKHIFLKELGSPEPVEPVVVRNEPPATAAKNIPPAPQSSSQQAQESRIQPAPVQAQPQLPASANEPLVKKQEPEINQPDTQGDPVQDEKTRQEMIKRKQIEEEQLQREQMEEQRAREEAMLLVKQNEERDAKDAAMKKLAEEQQIREAEERQRLAAEEKRKAEELALEELKKVKEIPPVETAKQDGILDPEKARRIEQMLSDEPLDKQKPETKQSSANTANQATPFRAVVSAPVPANEPPQEVRTQSEMPQAPAPEVKPEPAPEPVKIKRKYDEPGIDDSVKSLKKRFDQIVYSARPARKPDTIKKVDIVPQKVLNETQKAGTKTSVTPSGIIKEETPKTPDAKKTLPANSKKPGVEVTKTGIQRDLKKLNAEKEKNNKQKAETSKGKKEAPSKKTDPKTKKSQQEPSKNNKGQTAKGKQKTEDKKPSDKKKAAEKGKKK